MLLFRFPKIFIIRTVYFLKDIIYCEIRDKSQLIISAIATMIYPKGNDSYQCIRVIASKEDRDGSADR